MSASTVRPDSSYIPQRQFRRYLRLPSPSADPFPPTNWEIYRRVIERARERDVPFALGGAIGLCAYTGQWRTTRDLDFYIRPDDRDAMIQVLAESGLSDYYEKASYDRGWIYRGHADDTIADLIWGMPNQRTQVDHIWLDNGPEVTICGERLAIVPPEEMLWAKLYVMQRERCDWPDIFNLLYATGPTLDWEHLLERVGTDLPLLTSLLSTFRWLAPAHARTFPAWLWRHVELPVPEMQAGAEIMKERAFLLDTRPWFLPTLTLT